MTKTKLNRIAVRALVALLAASIPALAEIDLSGSWAARAHEDAMDRGPGPYAVDYLGLPLNDAGRAKALSYSGSIFSMMERECMYYPASYLVLGPQGIKIWADSDMVNGKTIAWNISASNDRAPIKIWMDGRPHPSKTAPHGVSGFTTGVWEGDVLTSYTTHMKAGYIRRNGAPSSDEATLTTTFLRHGDLLTVAGVIEDPYYLTEPFVVTRNFVLDTVPIRPVDTPCVPGFEGHGETGVIPHYSPGKNPFVDEVTKLYNIPVEAVMGGPETMYPDYRKKLKDKYVAPEKCTRNCGAAPSASAAPPPAPVAQ
jgi:hypothetical protein